jgi:hypothetical protein
MLEVNINFKGVNLMHKKNRFGVSKVVLGLGVLLTFTALQWNSDSNAFPAYRQQLVTQYHLVDKRVTCQYCHVNAGGGAPWNAFGTEVKALNKGNIAKALYDVLEDDTDADKDGYKDALEVFAGTLPGDKASMPLVNAQTLETNFESAGGLELYQPE